MEMFQRSESNKRRRESRSRSRPQSSQSTVKISQDKTICMACRNPKEEDTGTRCDWCQESFHEHCLEKGAIHDTCGNIVTYETDSGTSESEYSNDEF